MATVKFRQIEVYWAVMRSGSVTGAARLLNVSQPAVTKTLQQAEASLGVLLFQRSQGRMIPTPEAEALFPDVDRIYRQLDALQAQAAQLKSFQQGQLRIGTTSTLSAAVLPAAVRAFQQAYPRFLITVSLLPANVMAERLAANAIEIGLAMTASGEQSIESEPIGTTRLVCLMPKRHELAALEVVRPRDLAPFPMIGFSPETAFGQSVQRAFAVDGARLRSSIQVDMSLQALAFVQGGCGIALVDDVIAAAPLAGTTWRPFEPVLSWSIYMLRARERPFSRAARAFGAIVGASLTGMGAAPAEDLLLDL